MKKFSILALGVIAGLCAVARVEAAAQSGQRNERLRGDQVCVYKDINYQGVEQCYRVGDEVNDLGAQRRSISSIRVYGRGTVITVYENTAFRGHSTQFSADVANLGLRTMAGNTVWSDHIDSLRISGSPDSNDRRPDAGDRRPDAGERRGQSQQPRDGICVYERPNYQGRSDCWNQGQNFSDLGGPGNWNQQISSIRVFGRAVAVVYQSPGYRGERLVVDRNIPDLAAIRANGNDNDNDNRNGNGNGVGRPRGNGRNFRNWAYRISSLQIQAQRPSR